MNETTLVPAYVISGESPTKPPPKSSRPTAPAPGNTPKSVPPPIPRELSPHKGLVDEMARIFALLEEERTLP